MWRVGLAAVAGAPTGRLVSLLVLCLLVSCAEDVTGPAKVQQRDPPAQKVISLSPHLAELVFASGAGQKLVGAVDYSDYPEAARFVPRIGDSFRLDYEAIAALQPDLILAWQGGNPADMIQRLRSLGYRVMSLEATSLESIGQDLRRIGDALGTADTADQIADEYERELMSLREKYAGSAPVRVFYQVSWAPLFTISGRHVIGQAIELCGGRNVFAAMQTLSPAVSLEAVLDANPEAIVASDFGAGRADSGTGLSGWSAWQHLAAVQRGNLYFVDADYMVRPGIRIIEGVRQMCDRLDRARSRIELAS